MDSPSSSKSVSLPSIHEMFPEHRFQHERDPSRHSQSSSRSPQLPPPRMTSPSSKSGAPESSSRPLRDLSSSSTYLNRGSSVAFQLGTDRGSAPIFRVSTTAPPSETASSLTAVTSTDRPRGSSLNVSADNSMAYTKDSSHSGTRPSGYPSVISFPVVTSEPMSRRTDYMAEDGNNSEGEVSNEPAHGKKHVCPTCFKRFNRPSSLRIHVNTHTGATPFRCPWPNCGREFNVNSNMRRHYRNHTTPGFTRQPNDMRRRRRRPEPGFPNAHIPEHGRPLVHRGPRSDPYEQTYPGSDESDGYESDYGKPGPGHEEFMDYDLHPAAWAGHPHAMPRGAVRGSSRSAATASIPRGSPPHSNSYYSSHHHAQQPSHQPHHHYPSPPPGYPRHPHPSSRDARQYGGGGPYHHQEQPGAYNRSPRPQPYPSPISGRSYTPAGSSFHSSSPSPSPSPPPGPSPRHAAGGGGMPPSSSSMGQKELAPVYTASIIPHMRSAADSCSVSTTLRPAFSAAPPPRVVSDRHSYAGRASGRW